LGYKKPTLVEIFAEIHLQPGVLTEAQFFDVVPKLREAGFSEVEFATGGISLEFQAGGPRTKEKQRIRCWKPGKRELAQVGEDLLVVNLTGLYPGWKHFVRLFAEAFNAVRGGLGSVPARSLNLRTIDRFSVLKNGFHLSDYLQVGGRLIPGWYKDWQESMDISAGKGFLQYDGKNRVIAVAVRTFTEPVTLEFQGTFHDAVADDADLKEVLEALHNESNETFESLITDRTRQDVMGGPDK
jgi:uncharacterized protein (TIGR04255 family)